MSITTTTSDRGFEKLKNKSNAYQQTPRFRMAMAKIPNYEVDDFRRLTQADETLSNTTIRYFRAVNRYENPICCNPTCSFPEGGKRRELSRNVQHKKTLWCSCCCIVSYCSKTCQVAHHPLHRVWAANLPDTPRPKEEDPMGLVCINMVTSERRYIDVHGNLVAEKAKRKCVQGYLQGNVIVLI